VKPGAIFPFSAVELPSSPTISGDEVSALAPPDPPSGTSVIFIPCILACSIFRRCIKLITPAATISASAATIAVNTSKFRRKLAVPSFVSAISILQVPQRSPQSQPGAAWW